MLVRLNNLKADLDHDDDALVRLVAEQLGIAADAVCIARIVRKSVDARNKRRVRFIYTVDVEADGLDPDTAAELAAPAEEPDDPVIGSEPCPGPPVIVGAGPSGMFAALELARFGYRPVLIERGKRVEDRVKDVTAFLDHGSLNTESNILFGAGGAGTFSDGKLTTRRNHPRTQWVFRTLVECGASESVAYDARPHVGTDRLRAVCANVQRRIVEHGGAVLFEERVDELRVKDDEVRAVRTTNEIVDAHVLIWAGGQHCRRSYEMLDRAGAALAAKPFQLGVRIEHAQYFIDRAQYGPSAGHPSLPAADYALVSKGRGGVPGIHSFCMCPGGQVIPAINEPGTMATNGWSYSARDMEFANSALVATVHPEDLGGAPFDGFDFRSGIEKRAFRAASGMRCPAQLAADFLMGRKSDEGVRTSFPLGISSVPVDRFMPRRYCEGLRRALKHFDKIIPGFTHRPALLLGPETRASSPVRIVRDRETRESLALRGLYPVGEGAGYAGGIMTSILDGIETARTVMARYAPPQSAI